MPTEMVDIRRAVQSDRQKMLALVALHVGFGPCLGATPPAMTRTDLGVIDKALPSTTQDRSSTLPSSTA